MRRLLRSEVGRKRWREVGVNRPWVAGLGLWKGDLSDFDHLTTRMG